MEIIQNVHRVPHVIANAYLIINPHGLTVIDAGLPGSAKRILKYIINRGYAPAASILFVGDSIISDKKGLIPAVKDTLWDHPRAMAAVREQAALGASIVCSGHGPVIRNAVGKYPQV